MYIYIIKIYKNSDNIDIIIVSVQPHKTSVYPQNNLFI